MPHAVDRLRLPRGDPSSALRETEPPARGPPRRSRWQARTRSAHLRHPALQPGLEHGAGEADVAADAQARQGAGADGFVDPAWLDGEQLGRFGRREERGIEPVDGVVVRLAHRASSGWFMRAMAGSVWPGLVTAAVPVGRRLIVSGCTTNSRVRVRVPLPVGLLAPRNMSVRSVDVHAPRVPITPARVSAEAGTIWRCAISVVTLPRTWSPRVGLSGGRRSASS